MMLIKSMYYIDTIVLHYTTGKKAFAELFSKSDNRIPFFPSK